MELEKVGALLRNSHDLAADTGEFLKILDRDLSGSDAAGSLMPSMMISHPRYYQDRKGEFIAVCGMVHEGTAEYDSGCRFFDNKGRYFLEDGRYSRQKNTPDDLVSFIVDLPTDSASVEFYRQWVHPQHRNIKAFFRPLTPASKSIIVNRQYLNRRGFVIEIVDEVQDDDGSYFVDDEDVRYHADGSVIGETSSMLDLTHRIESYELFKQQDWTSESVLNKDEAGDWSPELFDPSEHDKTVRLKIFFDAVMTAQEVARRFGYDFSFNVNTN
jgi:hypothetical protein